MYGMDEQDDHETKDSPDRVDALVYAALAGLRVYAVKVECLKPGCTKSIPNGDALHRTSPKGEEFEGLCTEHYKEIGGDPDWVATVMERDNHGET